MTLTFPLSSIAPLAVAPPLTFPLLSPLSSFLAHGRCYRTWVPITYQFFYLSLSLRYFVPTNVRLPSIFRELPGMTLLLTSTLTILLQRNTRLFLLPLLLFSSLALNTAKSSIPFGGIKRHPKTWVPAEVEEAVSERRNVFAAAHRSDEDCQAYISAFQHASSVVAKANAKAWQTTCSSPSPKFNPESVYSLLVLLLAFLSPLETSPTVPLPGNRLRSLPII